MNYRLGGISVVAGAVLAVLAGGAQALEAGEERVWIQFKKGKADQVVNLVGEARGRVHHRFDKIDAMAASMTPAAIEALRKNPNIAAIEPDHKRFLSAQTVPYGIDAVQARDVWDADRNGVVDAGAPTGAGRTICIIDSGLYTGHEDMQGVNIIGGEPAGWDTDLCGHGTHVAGTVAAAHNDLGVVGAAIAPSIYAVKVFGDDCSWTYSSDLVNAAQQCVNAGANVISMSLGGSSKSNAESAAFQGFLDQGVLSIAAAGNDGNTRKSYPASYPSVISVAAVDSNNVIADFSQQNNAVELAAPGVAVQSTVPWNSTNTLTIGGTSYSGSQIEFAALGSSTGPVVDGGICDSVGSWAGAVVMCERGTISFFDKVSNAEAGGAVGTVIYNNVPGGFTGTLGTGNSSNFPAISLSQEDGQAIVATSLGQSGDIFSDFSVPGSGYEAWDGTSMATPHVSAVAALIWSSDPTKTATQIRDAMTSTALDLGTAGYDNAYGHGLVQAFDAWQALGGGGGGNIPPVASYTDSCLDLACTFDASASSDADGAIVSYDWDFGDGNVASGVSVAHSFAAAGSYAVAVTVTDDAGASSTSSRSISVGSGGGDVTPPVISNVSAATVRGRTFEITWTTDEAADSLVTFTCCGSFSDPGLVTSHVMSFRGDRGVTYEYTVSSTDAAGNTATSGPFFFQL